LYQTLYWGKLKDPLQEEYNAYMAATINAGKTPQKLVAWRNERCRELLEAETDEVKEVVQKAFESAKGGKSVSASQEPTYDKGDSPEQVHQLRMNYYERYIYLRSYQLYTEYSGIVLQ
jgi:hypothetical protein